MKTEKKIVELTDDIDGTGSASTVAFGLDGRVFEIELNKRNEAALRKALAPYIEKARDVRKSSAPAKRKGQGRKDSAAIRVWARENGVEVSPIGRVPQAVVDQYEAAKVGA